MAKSQLDGPSESIEDVLKKLSQSSLEDVTIDLSSLEGMSKDELLSLAKRMAMQCGLVASMTDEETARAMLDTLAHTALKPIVGGINMKADIDSRLKAIEKWLDRTKGKPHQSVTMTEKKTIQLVIELGRQADEILTIDNDA